MPITLPQLSRREFLKRAALAGVGLGLVELVPPRIFAEAAGKLRDEHTFAFFSDAHIAADASAVKNGANMAEQLAACVRELSAWPAQPAALIVNGDLALNDGRAGDYTTFGKLLEPVRALAPVHLNLGNHDQREHFWSAFPQDAAKQKSVPKKQCAVLKSARANWFLLDSLDKTLSTPGELGQDQIAWMNTELTARAELPAIIVAHHNLQAAGAVAGIKDTPALEELFARHRQVKAFVFGHTHNWSVTTHTSGVHLINLPPTAYVFKKERPSGWVRCTLASDGAEFELRALDTKHPEHAQPKQLKWRTA